MCIRIYHGMQINANLTEDTYTGACNSRHPHSLPHKPWREYLGNIVASAGILKSVLLTYNSHTLKFPTNGCQYLIPLLSYSILHFSSLHFTRFHSTQHWFPFHSTFKGAMSYSRINNSHPSIYRPPLMEIFEIIDSLA